MCKQEWRCDEVTRFLPKASKKRIICKECGKEIFQCRCSYPDLEKEE